MSQKRQNILSKVLIYLVLVIVALVWTIPTLGLLVGSFRKADNILASGWWTVLANPDREELTLINYRVVLGIPTEEDVARFGGAETLDLTTAILNSLTVTIPATLIPIMIAAFGAYGFA